MPLAISAPFITSIFFPALPATTYTLVTLAQYCFIAISLDPYFKMLRAILSIEYKAKEHKVQINKYKFPLLKEAIEVVDPIDIEKTSR